MLKERKKSQRPICTITKAEFIIFHALLIGDSVHSAKIVWLWKEDSLLGINSEDGKKQRVGSSELWKMRQ